MGQEPRINFTWDIHWECNYRCPYCWWHGRWDEVKVHNRYPGLEKLKELWKRIYDIYGTVKIEITGGEPSAYPDFFEFISSLLDYHKVGITTNLSFDVGELVEKLGPEKLKKLGIGATFHPTQTNYDDFIKNIDLLKENAMGPGVLYLAWPPQVKKIPELREEFKRHNVDLSVLTFWGEYKGKKYPDSYTDEERRIIGLSLGKRSGEDFQVKPFKPKGKLCNAGHIYGTIHPDGEVIRCGGGSWDGGEVVIGNIFDDDFKLWAGPEPCPYESCPCNEWAFLLVNEEDKENKK